MASKTKKITQNVNKDAGLLDMPRVSIDSTIWLTKHSNYCSFNTGEIYPIYCEEVVPKSKRKITMAMLSHMTTPKAPFLNALYTELRAFWVPHRLSSDLLGGYKTRRSPWVKVFGEDPAVESSEIVVPVVNQTLPEVSSAFSGHADAITKKAHGGLFDALDYEPTELTGEGAGAAWYKKINFLSMSAYELIYQFCYRNQNRESATESPLYKFLYNAYNKTGSDTSGYDDSLHIANREKDYFTGAQPFTQKGGSVSVGLTGNAPIMTEQNNHSMGSRAMRFSGSTIPSSPSAVFPLKVDNEGKVVADLNEAAVPGTLPNVGINVSNLVADLSAVSGVNIESLRLMIKTQEMLEKDMMYGSDYASFLNAHFSVRILKGFLDEPQEIKKVIVTNQMQAVLQSSTTSGEPTILGTIGANATTQSGEIEIVPETFFPEFGYLIICAVHKSQNVYDSLYFKPKHIFKKARFDYFQPEIEDLGYQKVSGEEMNYAVNGSSAVGFNEAFAEYRYRYNKCHGMVEPGRSNALDYWTTAMSNYNDIESLYKQGKDEVDRGISVYSSVAPQFFDAYGFIEIHNEPMKLHSIPGSDIVI